MPDRRQAEARIRVFNSSIKHSWEPSLPGFKEKKRNIMKLIGFTNWFDPNYEECEENLRLAIDLTIAYMKQHGLKFHGFTYQHGRNGVPCFDNGEKLCLSMRAWGALMAKVLGIEGTFNYTHWAWDTPDGQEEKLPDESVCFWKEDPPPPRLLMIPLPKIADGENPEPASNEEGDKDKVH